MKNEIEIAHHMLSRKFAEYLIAAGFDFELINRSGGMKLFKVEEALSVSNIEKELSQLSGSLKISNDVWFVRI